MIQFCRVIERQISLELNRRLADAPALALLGPRQVGKTTLAQTMAEIRPSLDLGSGRDRAKLADPETCLESHESELVILDEVHRMPDLFQILRGLIDRGRSIDSGPADFCSWAQLPST